jgi:hypothetical protein
VLTGGIGVPRLAAIEYPLGYLLGPPGDKTGQLNVLRKILEALAKLKEPGSVINLPFVWPETAQRLNAHPPTPPPISKYLLKHPWQLPKLLSREIPVGKG